MKAVLNVGLNFECVCFNFHIILVSIYLFTFTCKSVTDTHTQRKNAYANSLPKGSQQPGLEQDRAGSQEL